MSDWDFNAKIVLEDDGSDDFTMLEPGEYDYTITKVEPDQTLDGRNKVVLTMSVGDKGKKVQIKDHILIQENMLWKMKQVFKSVGLLKPGDKLEATWSDLKGKTGRCKVYVNTWKTDDGRERKNNRVDEFLPPSNDDLAFKSDDDEFPF